MSKRIPSLFHFVYGLKPQTAPFHIIHYLCIASCIKINRPEKIYFYYHFEPYGRYWDLIKENLTCIRVPLDPFVSSYAYQDREVQRFDYAHHADFIRLDNLMRRGGVYADIDTIFVNPIPEELYRQPFVLGREPDIISPSTGQHKPSLCNAFIMAEKNARFGRYWLAQMKEAFDGTWSNHSTVLPSRLSRRHPELIHVEPQRSFYKHPWTREGIHTLLQGCDVDLQGVISLHLWAHLWWSRKRRDFSKFHAKQMTETYIRRVDTTYNRIARNHLPGARKRRFWSFLPRWSAGRQVKGDLPRDLE